MTLTPDHTSSATFADAGRSFDDTPHTSSDFERIPEPEPEPELEYESDGKPYSLRQVNYAIPAPLEDLAKSRRRRGGRNGGRGVNAIGKGRLVRCLQWRRLCQSFFSTSIYSSFS